jgi:hypothetical protein
VISRGNVDEPPRVHLAGDFLPFLPIPLPIGPIFGGKDPGASRAEPKGAPRAPAERAGKEGDGDASKVRHSERQHRTPEVGRNKAREEAHEQDEDEGPKRRQAAPQRKAVDGAKVPVTKRSNVREEAATQEEAEALKQKRAAAQKKAAETVGLVEAKRKKAREEAARRAEAVEAQKRKQAEARQKPVDDAAVQAPAEDIPSPASGPSFLMISKAGQGDPSPSGAGLGSGPEPADAAKPAAEPEAEFSSHAKASLWLHDGSRMKLVSEGERVLVEFDRPREGLDKYGITHGSLLFQGKRHGKTYSGEAATYAPPCAAHTFPVTGEPSLDYRRFSLHGKVPILDGSCKVTGTRDETLTFDYEGAAQR